MFIDLPPVLKFVKELKKVAMVKKNVHIRLVTDGFQAEGCIVKIKQIACPVTHPELLSKGFGVVGLLFFLFFVLQTTKSHLSGEMSTWALFVSIVQPCLLQIMLIWFEQNIRWQLEMSVLCFTFQLLSKNIHCCDVYLITRGNESGISLTALFGAIIPMAAVIDVSHTATLDLMDGSIGKN